MISKKRRRLGNLQRRITFNMTRLIASRDGRYASNTAGLHLLCHLQNLLDSSPIFVIGTVYVKPQKAPDRAGKRRDLTRWTLLQRQITDRITPVAFSIFCNLMRNFACTTGHSEGIETGPGKVECVTTRVISVKFDVVTINTVACSLPKILFKCMSASRCKNGHLAKSGIVACTNRLHHGLNANK